MVELYPKGHGLAAIVGLTEKQVSTLVEGAFTARDPLVDLRFFHSVPFSSATLLGLCAFASFAGFLFLNTLYLQQVRGFSAFGTGVFTLPLAIMIIICAPLSGRLVGDHGTRPSLLAAGTGLLLSSLMLTHLNIGTPMVLLMLAYASFGVGYGRVHSRACLQARISGNSQWCNKAGSPRLRPAISLRGVKHLSWPPLSRASRNPAGFA
jgi:hypothetical protein